MARVSPHRISADSIAHPVLQALDLDGILNSLLSLTFHIYSISRSYSSAANTHLQPLHLVISHLSPSYPSQTWGKFPRKLSKMKVCVQQGHWDRLGQGKQGWAEGEELRFRETSANPMGSSGMAWDVPKSRQEDLDLSLAGAAPGRGSSSRGAQLCILSQWSLQLEGCVSGPKGDLSASSRRLARRAGQLSCSPTHLQCLE